MPLPAIVIAGIKLAPLIISGIGRLIGMAPRGDLQKFQRTVYPYMKACASSTGYPVYCFWFGDLVVVNPDGSYGVDVPNLGSISASDMLLQDRAANGSIFYYADCGRADDDCVNNPKDLNFVLYGYELADVKPSETAENGYGMGISQVTNPQPAIAEAGIMPNSSKTVLLLAGAVIAFVAFSKR